MKYILCCLAAAVLATPAYSLPEEVTHTQKEQNGTISEAVQAAADKAASLNSTTESEASEHRLFSYGFAMSGVMQGHNAFAENSGGNHYLGNGTLTLTLRPSSSTEITVAPMWMYGDMAGSGIGIGGNPNALFSVSSPTPFLGTAYIRQNINLKEATEQSDEIQMTLTAGKVTLPSLFEANTYASDPASQFLNISSLGFGAWELAQEARGTTIAAGVHVGQKSWSMTFAAGMLPSEAGGAKFNTDISNSYSLTAQLAFDYTEGGRLRVLGFMNRDNAIDFKLATQLLTEQQNNTEPDIETARGYCWKQGLGLEIEQGISQNIGSFLRASWNDGRTESFTVTEINASVSGGLDLSGALWGAEDHHAGIIVVHNELSTKHRHYLEAGGEGFMLSGSNLSYSGENITEMYYRAAVSDNLSVSLDYQFIANPGYNSTTQSLHLLATRLTLGL